jgi:hypothetical protein
MGRIRSIDVDGDGSRDSPEWDVAMDGTARDKAYRTPPSLPSNVVGHKYIERYKREGGYFILKTGQPVSKRNGWTPLVSS